jgi:hypothetical protein
MKKICTLFMMCLLTTMIHGQWSQKGLDIDGEAAGDNSGSSVSINSDGNTVAIGAPHNGGTAASAGHVRVYVWNGSTWTQKGADIDGEAGNDISGWSVSINSDGSTVAIGSIKNTGAGTNAGHVRVYEWSGTSWIQKGVDIDAEASQDQFGRSVSLSSDGNIVAVGATQNDGAGTNAGHVRIYEWSGTSWVQKGADIDGEAPGDVSGYYVSLASAGSVVAIGAPYNSDSGTGAGHTRVYEWSGSAWTQKGADIDGEAADDRFGFSVSMSSDGNIAAVGATQNDGAGTNAGHVRVYEWSGTSWVQKGADIDGEAPGDVSGFSVSMSSNGNLVVIGAYGNAGTGTYAGHARIYQWNGSSWIQRGTDIDGEAEDDYSGFSVSMSSDGNTVAIGAHSNDGSGIDAGHVRVFSICSDVDSAVTQSGVTLTADITGADYQWLDCASGYSIILGDTSQSFTATINGNYAVEITQSDCIDTSACYSINGVGVVENDFGNDLLLFPNPSDGNFAIDLGRTYQTVTITMADLNGKLIQSKTYNKIQLLNMKLEKPAGIYLLMIESGDKKAVIRLVKE